jgi:hypothetical protein
MAISTDKSPADAPTITFAPQPLPVGKFDELVDQWFIECFYGTAVAQNSEALNVAMRAKDILKAKLNQA